MCLPRNSGAHDLRRSVAGPGRGPVAGAARWVWHNKGVVIPGVNLALETVGTYLFGKRFGSDENWRWIRVGAMTSLLTTVSVASMHAGAEFSKWWEKWGGGFVGS